MGWPASPTEHAKVTEVEEKDVKWCADVAMQERRAQLGSTGRKRTRVYRIEGMDVVVDQYGRVYGQVGKKRIDGIGSLP